MEQGSQTSIFSKMVKKSRGRIRKKGTKDPPSKKKIKEGRGEGEFVTAMNPLIISRSFRQMAAVKELEAWSESSNFWSLDPCIVKFIFKFFPLSALSKYGNVFFFQQNFFAGFAIYVSKPRILLLIVS